MKKKERTFSYPWGRGNIEEEAQITGLHHLPTFQLLRYTEGPAAGGVSIRFCYYSHQGRFSRSPLLMSDDEIDKMGVMLQKTPQLIDLLRRLLGQESEE